MKILATFDGTPFSEAVLPTLTQMAALPNAEITLMSVAHEPNGKLRARGIPRPIAAGDLMGRGAVVVDRTDPSWAEDKTQAIERRVAETEQYLAEICHKLPPGTQCHLEAHVADNVAETIIERAREGQVDVIVMATHSPSRIAQALFGSTTEHVVRSGVAPVLVVHPKE